ncbi:MAG: peptide-methionine (S)-S-oxide reductase [Verrucomicrobia bacterium CG_4_10_14_3_um_filter_43_23]|nr:MAG: peptide-methionine (S)-S-oxide reductase [Verrucomicrobia bacterium CG1_02_43_26]PIP59901.1 MAG: peptide-methionine (S)-S-oxide reductase [Verrucomicrobia bacterium CG22_combo_CG10-13_8_21_14_all_43_17]PIX58067.1 MAG: peptide-methionine (S)-S-oxide reductase [Verrucomicrobia bacterium CG_4_10_14_3_um_filter_43_23]PIY61162.1 MAG: peptide-methionine (S)-S-oxide reductase [Verrucomicrobia bacterium CG_4_10_14_0_8_um_filter_43_34]PJA43335.1 MAG: peptide-methionine (S)-S-oxide reductase [Ver
MQNPQSSKAYFAGGCFWCIEAAFDQPSTAGILKVTSGYMGGHVKNPTYEQVCTGKTGHYEVVEISYDPGKILYNDLLETFWHNIDPSDNAGQFADRGSQYLTAIFYCDEDQKHIAEESKALITARLGLPIVTDILPASEFYPAEDYHQRYYKTNPTRYTAYKEGSGRPVCLRRIWGK